MLRLATFQDLEQQGHSLGLYCPRCDRWDEADLDRLIASGRGQRLLTEAKFRCRDCGSPADKQVRPPVPVPGGAVGYI